MENKLDCIVLLSLGYCSAAVRIHSWLTKDNIFVEVRGFGSSTPKGTLFPITSFLHWRYFDMLSVLLDSPGGRQKYILGNSQQQQELIRRLDAIAAMDLLFSTREPDQQEEKGLFLENELGHEGSYSFGK